jgi:hypothetical protein
VINNKKRTDKMSESVRWREGGREAIRREAESISINKLIHSHNAVHCVKNCNLRKVRRIVGV